MEHTLHVSEVSEVPNVHCESSRQMVDRLAAMPRCGEFRDMSTLKRFQRSASKEYPIQQWNVLLDRTTMVLRVFDPFLDSKEREEDYAYVKSIIENLIVATQRRRRQTNRVPRVVFHIRTE